jgi:hypothetical protein
VHLLGAVVDAEEVSKNPADTGDSPFDDRKVYGQPIERQVNKFYNLYDDEDDMLEVGYSDPQFQPEYYPYFEKDYALGDRGAQAGIDMPQNYTDRSVRRGQVIARQDADDERGCDLINPFYPFNCTISTTQKGDNHFGYLGFRNPNNPDLLLNDGAIDIIVRHWRSS